MRRLLRFREATEAAVWMGTKNRIKPVLRIFRRHIVVRHATECLSVIKIYDTKLRLADARRVGQHGLEHRRQLAR